ncbi:M55 family metallopeptidase [Paenibacillus cymbidii]|uniref:M55 family metallopeptidase n=1 Tax=Paenibacillus cymbidii TaxID=1639034 RepID=UPI0010815BEE|nr:M55 family metallopeptidase [Paenibacillus cymbidii]
MKVYMMTDLEGVCGVLGFDQWAVPEGRYYDEAKRLLTLEVNAAIEGFCAAGATEIDVIDGHGHGGINQLLLDRRAGYLRGPWPGPYPLMMDESYDVMAFVGQHAKAGTPCAHMAHTGMFSVLDYEVNGLSVGEYGLYTMCGETMGIRTIFGSGDEAFAQEAQALTPGVETVSVKRGINPGSGDECSAEGYRQKNNGARHMHPERARELIRAGAEQALRRFAEAPETFAAIGMRPPYRKVVKYRSVGANPAYTLIRENERCLIELLNTYT